MRKSKPENPPKTVAPSHRGRERSLDRSRKSSPAAETIVDPMPLLRRALRLGHRTIPRPAEVAGPPGRHAERASISTPADRRPRIDQRLQPGAGSAVQRMKFQFVPSAVKASKTVQKKLDQVIPVLTKVVAGFGSDKATVKLQLIDESGISPAFSRRDWTKEDGYSGDVVITLNQWYAERASVGDILGMLVHELGVHAMADFEMGMTVTRDGRRLEGAPDAPISKERDTETQTHTLDKGLETGPFTMAPIDRDAEDRRQEDHVNVGKGLISGEARSRAEVYTKTFLETGKAINHNTKILLEERKRQLRDLVDSFFFDIARIVATDDGKPLSMYRETDAIAELMNFFHQEVVKKYGKKYPWLNDKELQVYATGSALRKRLRGLVGELIKSSNPTVQKARAGLGGGLLGLGAWAIGGFAAGPALAIGAVGGLGIWGASKLLGY